MGGVFSMHRVVRNSCRVLMRKSEGKLPVGILRCRWDGCIKMDLKGIGSKLMHWIKPAQDRQNRLYVHANKMRRIYCLTKEPLASQEGLCFMKFVHRSSLFYDTVGTSDYNYIARFENSEYQRKTNVAGSCGHCGMDCSFTTLRHIFQLLRF